MRLPNQAVRARTASFLGWPVAPAFFPVLARITAVTRGRFSTVSVDNLFPVLFFLMGAAIGGLSWGVGPEWVRLLGIVLLPLAWGSAPSRLSAALVVLGYYLCGARGLPGGAAVFFGEDAPAWFGWCLWLALSVVLMLAYMALWSACRRQLAIRFVLAVCVTLLPPLGFVGVLSPVAVAGVLFPSLGWLGLALALGFLGFLAGRCWRAVGVLVVVSLAANGLSLVLGSSGSPPSVLARWQGVDTQFARLASGGMDDAGQLLAAQRRVEAVREFALSVPANSVAVLPETVLGPLDGISEFALMQTEAELAARGARLLVGAELAGRAGRAGRAGVKEKNVAVILGSQLNEDRFAVQGIPAPFAMWRPWAEDGFGANVFGHENTVRVNGVQVAVLICYEQGLAYSSLWAMVSSPDALVAVSNVWWARDTSIPEIQRQMMGSFARLFGVGLVVAKNS